MTLDPHKIIKNLEEGIIDEMLHKFFYDDEALLDLGRGIQLKALSDSAISTGVDYVFNKCTKPILFELERGESYATGGPENEKSRSKPIVVENLSFKCAERGFTEFLKGKDVSTIEKIAEKLKVTGDDKEELIDSITEEANYQGLSKLFEAFNPRTLKDWCELMDIHIESSSKKRLARGLIYGEDSGPTSTRQYGQTEEEKADLVAGTSEEDIKKSYTVNELKKFCSTSEIPSLGTKDILVNRIYRFLQGEEIDENEGKRKKSGADEDAPPVEKKQKVEEPEPSLSISSSVDDEDDESYNENGDNAKGKKRNGRKKVEDKPKGDSEDEPIEDDADEPMGEINEPTLITTVPVAKPILSPVPKNPPPAMESTQVVQEKITPEIKTPTSEPVVSNKTNPVAEELVTPTNPVVSVTTSKPETEEPVTVSNPVTEEPGTPTKPVAEEPVTPVTVSKPDTENTAEKDIPEMPVETITSETTENTQVPEAETTAVQQNTDTST